MQRIAITGSSGYFGRHLVRHIHRAEPQVEILGLDITPPRDPGLHAFADVDVRSPRVRGLLEAFRPDTVVHLAFVVNPLHDEARMHDININGSRNVFDAVDKIGPKRFLAASSATAFGARPDNPVPIEDRWHVRGGSKFKYAQDKTQLEQMLAEFADLHPKMNVSWVRPCIVYGPGVDNYLSRMLLQHPFVVLPDGCDVPQQFVHEDDVIAAIWSILTHGGRGPYNVGPPDWIPLTDVAREAGRRTITIPLWLMQMASWVCWGLRLPVLRYPPAMNQFIRYPWVVAPTRLCGELGFRFKFSSRETLRAFLRSQAKLGGMRDAALPNADATELRRAG